MLKEICKALMESDINIRLIQGLRKNVKESINLEENSGAVNKKRNIQKVQLRYFSCKTASVELMKAYRTWMREYVTHTDTRSRLSYRLSWTN